MRAFRRWKSGALALIGLVAALGVAGVAQAQQPLTLPMSITENRLQGATGQVTMTPMPNDQVRVDIRITGLPPNGAHAAHIHTASGARCDTGAPVTYPLTNVAVDGAGVGTSTTTVTLTADKPVQANNAYVNVHQMAQGGPGVICADVTQSFVMGAAAPAAGGTGGQTPVAMPRTGTGGLQADAASRTWTLAGFAAIAVLLGGTASLAVARRRA
jgi:hypothetical protein